ncbi:bacteriohemerythrin [Acidihalobacter prosperus]|uniref:Hemerythrin-like domain-containing protein n=1 Tax=Acidihalobacter prosperus TaxID=160660 RepID=A0A1A6C1I7_9GAMM|nr:bacteriohemerythrin [Acidihalobacter prosperus]OBS08427.1 hypothetical protein Thpro_022677 [Acidihalobacter prosperus]
MTIKWTRDLNTGIDVIDRQHMRIADYINELEDIHHQGDRQTIGRVLDELMDYTLSHFAFEERLQEEAGYEYAGPHKKVHELFARRVRQYLDRFRLGDDVAGEIHGLLRTWLISHIKHDDADYVSAVRDNMLEIVADKQRRRREGWLSRLLG